MNGQITLEGVSNGWFVGTVQIQADADGKLWATGYGCGLGAVPVSSAEAAKGKPLVVVTESGRTMTFKGCVVRHISCTSKTIGEYEASGFWAGGS